MHAMRRRTATAWLAPALAAPPTTPPAVPPSWPGNPSLPVLMGLALLLSTAIAIAMTLAVPGRPDLRVNLVYSLSIGLGIALCSLLTARLPRLAALPAPWPVVGMLGLAMPLGYLGGLAAARTLLGHGPVGLDISQGSPAGILATLLATVFVGLLIWGQQRLALEAAARAQAQRLAVEAELRLLRAQLEPHMLFNTLANLRALVEEEPQAALPMMDSLIAYLRGTLLASRQACTTLEQEFHQLRAYLELMAMRMGTRLAWTLELPQALRATAIPPMLLQPLVENAIRHGLEPQVGPGSVAVRAWQDGAQLYIEVVDTGRGLGGGKIESPASGYGLAHVRERLRSAYGEQARLTLQPSSPHGVRAVVSLPS
jgi:signal transduction histidine kinase